MLASLKIKARQLKQHTLTVYFAARDPRTPILVRVLALLIAAYALSPIDLIPDFIPVLGYLDDLLLVPLGIVLVVRLIPADLIAELRAAAETAEDRPASKAAASVIVVIWLLAIAGSAWLAARWYDR